MKQVVEGGGLFLYRNVTLKNLKKLIKLNSGGQYTVFGKPEQSHTI